MSIQAQFTPPLHIISAKRMLAKRQQSPTIAKVKVEPSLSGIGVDLHPMASIKKNKNKRRFSDEQIKLLEFMFESESRPESQIKQKLSNELGLEPRQVAIWFQNRRARLKTKQIEQDYNILKASYDILVSSFESLKSENQSLRQQLQKLKNLPQKLHESKTSGLDVSGNSFDGKSDSGDTNSESKEMPRHLFEGYDHKIDMPMNHDNNTRTVDSTGEDTANLNMVELTDGSLSSSEKWCSFESSCFLDESSCSSQWWEFWS